MTRTEHGMEKGVIEPTEAFARERGLLPPRVVLCFASEMIESACAEGRATVLRNLSYSHGTHPIYSLRHNGTDVAVVAPGTGAPLAVMVLEAVIAMGARSIIACGGAGSLVSDLELGQTVVPVTALRGDEGTSAHYFHHSAGVPLPTTVEADALATTAIETTLHARDVKNHRRVKTWTTDAFYRETRGKIEQRKAQGCEVVEMEAAALFAVGKFRQVHVGGLFYAADVLADEGWEHRDWDKAFAVREALFWTAVDACIALEQRVEEIEGPRDRDQPHTLAFANVTGLKEHSRND